MVHGEIDWTYQFEFLGPPPLRPVLMAIRKPESGIFGPDSGFFSGHWSPDFRSHVTFQLGFQDSAASWPNGFQKLESGKVMIPKSKAES